MKLHHILTILLFIVVAVVAFWNYTQLRGMSEMFGFSLRSMLWDGLFATMLTVPVIFIPIALSLFPRLRPYRRNMIRGVIFSGLFAFVVAETWIQFDEWHFRREAYRHESTTSDEYYSRDRTWPMRGNTLIYQRGGHFHATD